MIKLIFFNKIVTKALFKSTSILNLRKITEYFISTSNQREKMIATDERTIIPFSLNKEMYFLV